MGSGDAWLGRHPCVLWFHVCTVARPVTHAWLQAVEIPTGCHHTSCLWAAIRWVPATSTSRTLSLTRSVVAHLSGLWVTLWQRWHQFHFGGAASYRYFLHNRKCRPGKKIKKGNEKLAGLGRRQGFLKGLSLSRWDSDGNDPALQRRQQPASQGLRWDVIWKQCGQKERPQRSFKGCGFCFGHHTLWLFQVYTFPRSWLFHLWSGDYK